MLQGEPIIKSKIFPPKIQNRMKNAQNKLNDKNNCKLNSRFRGSPKKDPPKPQKYSTDFYMVSQ
jgi:hypothetical protein